MRTFVDLLDNCCLCLRSIFYHFWINRVARVLFSTGSLSDCRIADIYHTFVRFNPICSTVSSYNFCGFSRILCKSQSREILSSKKCVEVIIYGKSDCSVCDVAENAILKLKDYFVDCFHITEDQFSIHKVDLHVANLTNSLNSMKIHRLNPFTGCNNADIDDYHQHLLNRVPVITVNGVEISSLRIDVPKIRCAIQSILQKQYS